MIGFNGSLFNKIFFIIFFSIFAILSVFAYKATSLQKESIVESLRSEAKSVSDAITFFNRDNLMTNDETGLLEFTYEFVQSNSHIVQLILSREKGDMMVIEQNAWRVESKQHSLKLFEQEKEVYKIRKMNEKNHVFFYSYPIVISSVEWGWIHLSMSLDEYDKKIDTMYKQFYYLALIFLVMSVGLSYVLARLISKPIVRLNKVSQAIANGDLSRRAQINSKDEIGNLGFNFNKMVESLENSHKALQETNDELEDRVAQRTLELEKTNKALKTKSTQLKELNENLEQRVHEEIEKQQSQEQMMLQQNKLAAMGEMIGNIAHQWRQPLNALGLVIQNIEFNYENGLLDDESMHRSTKKARMLTLNMSKTIDDFRNFFKPNKEREAFSLQDSVEKTIYLIETSFNAIGIKIIKNIIENKRVYGFSNEFSQALMNILTNAKDALIENKIEDSIISIDIDCDDKYGYVIVQDNANGIPLDVIEKIFDPYFTTKEEGQGTGIGLYMSKIIIEKNMKGQLLVKNLEIGAEFTIKIPLYKMDEGM